MPQITRTEIADLIEAFLEGRSDKWEWDDFISVQQPDSELEKIRVRCAGLPDEFPANKKGHYCGPRGLAILKEFVAQLKK